jgi:signal transduction histidine kinase
MRLPAAAGPALLVAWTRPKRRWLRRPRRTIRMRLTLVYGGLFLVSGAGLLAITYVLVSHRWPVAATAHGGTPQPLTGTQISDPAGTGTQVCFFQGKPGAAATFPAALPNCLKYSVLARRQRATELRQLLIESGLALGIMTVLSIGLGYLVAGRVLRPLRTITAAAQSISASSLHARLALAGPDDELKELGDTFDGLLARLEATFSAQRQFVANASHELRTPLARQRTLIEVALASPQPSAASLQDVCRRMLAAGEEQERLIETLLTLARSQRGLDRHEVIDLAAITEEVVLAHYAEAQRRGLTVTCRPGPASARGDGRLAGRLVANLVDNAVRHNMAHGTVEISTGTWAPHAVLSVVSTGPVIPPAEVGRLFQPFQCGGASRTSSRAGLGLGLSIVSAIAEAHGAWLRADARPGGGLAVQVGFPTAAAAVRPPPGYLAPCR